jgi:hypothetical protein
LKKYLFILFLLCIFNIDAQTYNYSYTDPCTGNLKTIVVPINGNVTVAYYGELGSFNANDFTNGNFESWLVTNNASGVTQSGSSIVQANAGDFLDVRSDGTPTLTNASAQLLSVYIERLSGPSAIAASETVAARYTTNSGWTIANNSSTVVNFVTPDFDTHGAVTVGASWKFTAPISGKYRVNSVFQFPLGNYNSGAQFAISINKNGSTSPHSSSPVVVDDTAVSWYPGTSVSTVIHLNAGDYIDARVFQNNGAPANLSTDAASNYISINRIGN